MKMIQKPHLSFVARLIRDINAGDRSWKLSSVFQMGKSMSTYANHTHTYRQVMRENNAPRRLEKIA